MAKQATKTKIEDNHEEERLPTTQPQGGPPAELLGEMEAHAGEGLSTDQADNLVPLIYLLQSNSPQCLRGTEKHIPGAEAGDMWLRANEPGDEIIKNELGMLFQPCYFSKDWVEWQPNRGGFVARHVDKPETAELRKVRGDDGKTRERWMMPGGNVVVETRYHVGYVIMKDGRSLPYTIPLSSTGHSVSKQWMFSMNSRSLPSGAKAPMFSGVYRLRPKLFRKDQNIWFQYGVSFERWVNADEWRRGLALHAAFASGEKQVAEETEMTEEVPSDAAPSDPDGGYQGEYSDEV